MSNLRSSRVHINRPLTTMSVAYIQDEKYFISDKVFPTLPVNNESDTYFQYNKGDFFRNVAKERAHGTESAGGGFDLDNEGTYNCKRISWHDDIDEKTRESADAPLNIERDSTEYVTQVLMIKHERDWFDKYYKINIWGRDPVPGTKWDADNSDPVGDIDDEKEYIFSQTALMPNTLILSPDVAKVLRNHPDIIDRIKHVQKGFVTEDMLAGIFGVTNVFVARAIENTAKKGQTDVFSYMAATKSALLVYANPRPSLKKPSGGYTFRWKRFSGAGRFGNYMKKFWIEKIESDRIEGNMHYDQKLIAPDCGSFFKTVLT